MGDNWQYKIMRDNDLRQKLLNEFNKYLELEKEMLEHQQQNFNANVKSERPYEERMQERKQLISNLQNHWNNVILPIISEGGLDYNYGRGKTVPEPDDLRSYFGKPFAQDRGIAI